jgi:hypothetical protein
MGKRDRHFERVEASAERFRKLTTEQLRRILNNNPYLTKVGGIAIRQVLKERENRK